MLSSCASNTSRLLIPQNPFQNSPRNRSNCTKICRRKFCINAKLDRTHLGHFIISLAGSRVQFPECRLDKNTNFFTFHRDNEKKVVKDLDFGSSAQNSVPTFIAKSLAFAIFYVALAFCCPLGRFCVPPAVAATATGFFTKRKKFKRRNAHKYSRFTNILLVSVSQLLEEIENVKNGESDVSWVENALKKVKTSKKELQAELMEDLYEELRELREKKGRLVNQVKKLMDDASELNKEVTKEGVNEKEENLKMSNIEKECNVIWEKIGDIEDEISRRETMALSIGVRELLFIERECEQLVKAFLKEMKQPNVR